MHSLRARFLLMVVIVLAIAVGAVAIAVNRITSVQFEHYLSLTEGPASEPIARELMAYRARHGSWEGVEPLLARIRTRAGRVPLVAESSGTLRRPVGTLVDARTDLQSDGRLRVVRISRAAADGNRAKSLVLLHGTPLDTAGGKAGALYLVPEEAPHGFRPAAHFIGAVNRGLVVAVVAAGLLAATVALALGRRVLGPIEALTTAARRMAAGDRSQRVAARSRDEIGELALAFNAMADSVERSEAQRRELVGDVAHELRTPLTNLRCQIEALQDGLATPDAGTLGSLHEEVTLLARLVQDLQDLALGEAGGQRLTPGRLDSGEAVGRLVAGLQPRARAEGVTLTVRGLAGLPAVHADAERFGQILRNLVDNAVRHAGGAVEVSAEARAGHVAFAVRDDGPGIAAEHLPHVFERFYRTDASRARATGGAGLGLAIVRQLVTAHGGEVTVVSAPGEGATFTFTLPAAASS